MKLSLQQVSAMDTLLLLLLATGCLAQHNVPLQSRSASGSGGWLVGELSEHPWVVGVHRKASGGGSLEHICGGSLVSLQIVVSAAHCFWHQGKVLPLDRFVISAENYYRNLKDDENKQERKVKQIVVHERYRGPELKYAHDIAVLKLTEALLASESAKPIAIDWSTSFKDDQLKGRVGTVVGWGFTEYNEPSFARIAVSLPYVDFDTCWKTVPTQFRSSITPDKFCAGRHNGTSVCPGDSGGGLAFRGGSNVWYLRGVVSVGAQPEGDNKCHTTQLSAFTSIASYRDWLKNELGL